MKGGPWVGGDEGEKERRMKRSKRINKRRVQFASLPC